MYPRVPYLVFGVGIDNIDQPGTFQGLVDEGWQLLLRIATSEYGIYKIASPQQPLLLHPFLDGKESQIKQSGSVYDKLG